MIYCAGLLAGGQIALYFLDLYDDGVADIWSLLIGLLMVVLGLILATWRFRWRDGHPPNPQSFGGMNIRKLQEKDRDSLISLWTRVFPDDPPHNAPGQVIATKLNVDDLIFVSEQDHQIVGACMAGYDGHRGWLYAVAVSPEQRRRGLGTLLVKAALAELKSLGCVKVNLQIRPTNTAVAEFYKSLGFVIEDRLSMGAFIK